MLPTAVLGPNDLKVITDSYPITQSKDTKREPLDNKIIIKGKYVAVLGPFDSFRSEGPSMTDPMYDRVYDLWQACYP